MPTELSRVLITNDDGIDAPGLEVLIDVAKSLAQEVWVFAPEHDESGTGQSISLHHPLRCLPKGERRWAVSGTPADCVAVALGHFMSKTPPALILSGINAGANTGDDVNLSGTLGGAFMGLMLNVPSIAISQACVSRKKARWDTARAITPKVLNYFLKNSWRKDTCLSINIPDLPPEKITDFAWARQGIRTTAEIRVDVREDLRELKYYWLTLNDQNLSTDGNFDHAILERGLIAVSALSLDRSVEIPTTTIALEAKGAPLSRRNRTAT